MPFSYETQGATKFLTYRLSDGEALDQDAYGMLRNNEVPHVISPIYSQLDDARILRFDVTGLQVAREFFAGRTFSRQQLISVLLGVADGFAAASEYLLEERMVACSLDCLYFDNRPEVRMVYVPVDGFLGGADARSFLSEVFAGLKPDTPADVRYLVEIRSALGSASVFSVSAFQKLLGGLTLKPARPRTSVSAPLSSSADLGSAGLGSGDSPRFPGPPPVPSSPAHASTDSGSCPSFSGGQCSPSWGGSSGIAASAPSRGSGSFSGIAIPPASGSSSLDGTGDPGRLWPSVTGRLDEDEKPKKSPFSLKKKEKGSKKEKLAKKKAPKEKGLKGMFKKRRAVEAGDVDAAAQSPAPRAGTTPFAIPGQERPIGQNPSVPGSTSCGPSADWRQRMENCPPRAEYVEADGFGVTEVFGVSGETGSAPVAGTAYLKRIETGEVRPVDVTPFRIGRRQSAVDYYVPDRPRISRVHAIIEYQNGGFVITDNASANHTTVNGMELGSFEKVSLAHGDRIGLSDEEFLFLMG